MKVLIACEESQAVCKQFRARGHEAYSCDVMECSGGHPEWHIQDDVLKVINNGWDMMIAFPPCTHLVLSGARWMPEKRKDGRQREAIEFFMQMINAPIEKIAVENPMGIMSGGEYIKTHFPDLAEKYGLPIPYSQVIQPWMFGDGEKKATCLWLKNLPPLYHTPVNTLFECATHTDERNETIWKMPPGKDRAKLRSKTFPGIAKAMAEQWA